MLASARRIESARRRSGICSAIGVLAIVAAAECLTLPAAGAPVQFTFTSGFGNVVARVGAPEDEPTRDSEEFDAPVSTELDASLNETFGELTLNPSVSASIEFGASSLLIDLLATHNRNSTIPSPQRTELNANVTGIFEITLPHRYELRMDAHMTNQTFAQMRLTRVGHAVIDEVPLDPQVIFASESRSGVLEPGVYGVNLNFDTTDFGQQFRYPFEQAVSFRFEATPIPLPAAVWPALACMAAFGAKTLATRRRRRRTS